MSTFTMKTYKDSYLYNNKVSKSGNQDVKRTSQVLMDFIVNSHRIDDKRSDAFRGIVENIKRQQRSTILLTVLLMDNVKICINDSELPRAFKVFEGKDPKSNGQFMVFVDATGLIELRNGYYECRKIDVLCAYLADALVYLLYRYAPTKLINNSNITKIATESYTRMFNYVIDYTRISGFAENKKKITYLTSLFFETNMMSMELDDYTKSMAVSIAGLTPAEARPFELYIEDGVFTNIYTFITYIADLFKLKGLTLELFVSKWVYLFGTGTQYATELFTSFACLMSNAFSGSYIVNQKQVERCCGAINMVKFWNAIEKAGVSTFDNRAFMGESDRSIYDIHDRGTSELSEAIAFKNKLAYMNENVKPVDFTSKEDICEKVDTIISNHKKARTEDTLNKIAENVIMAGIACMYENAMNVMKGYESLYEDGTLTEVCKKFKNQLSDKQRYEVETTIRRDSDALREYVKESGCDKKLANVASSAVLEMRNIQAYI